MNTWDFFNILLNLDDNWTVDSVETGPDQAIVIHVRFTAKQAKEPDTNKGAKIYDLAPARRWRHLDTLQYKTYIQARLPRVKTTSGNIITTIPPWANKSDRHTHLFEQFIIALLLATKNQTHTAKLARCGFNVVNRIIHTATKRGLSRRRLDRIEYEHLSLDEKSFQKGHRYISVLSSPKGGFILDVEQDRTIKASKRLFNKTLNKQQQKAVKTISIDMWQAYMTSAQETLPHAKIVHDRFHLVKYLNASIDKVRRRECKVQSELLKNSRYALLKNETNLTDKQRLKFMHIQNANLEVSKVWQVRENFKSMFDQETTNHSATVLFEQWVSASSNLAIKEVSKVVDMFQDHTVGVVHSLTTGFNNAMAERLNGKIQILKTIGRGYRTFANFRSAILFFYGGLELAPLNSW